MYVNDSGRTYIGVLYIYALQLLAVASQTLEGFVSHTCTVGQLEGAQLRAEFRQSLQNIKMYNKQIEQVSKGH